MNAIWNDCSPNTSATIMRTARILDSGRKRRTTDGVPSPPVVSCLTSDSLGCIIVTIGLPDPDDLSPILISMSPVRAHISARNNLRGHQSILDGIATAIYFTVYFTGMSTTGASNRKLLFRVIGSAIGGLILGIGCLVFVFPNIEGVTTFLLVIAALAFVGAWVTASPYFGYIGMQITYAFNLLAFERLCALAQMQPARDRLRGIAFGFVAMFAIFHQVRPERTVDTMRRLLARLLRGGAELVRLLDTEPNAAIDARIAAIRKQMEAWVVNLRGFADVVKFEFDPDRAADMRLSDEILNAVTSAADVLLGIPTWPQKLADEQVIQLREIRSALQHGLREMASLLEQVPREQQPVPQETALEELPSTLPVAIAKTIDSYRELKMVCAGILRAAA